MMLLPVTDVYIFVINYCFILESDLPEKMGENSNLRVFKVLIY